MLAVWGCCQYIDARLWAVGRGQSSWGGCRAFLASWAQSHIARLLRDHVAKAGPLAVQLIWPSLRQTLRGARMGSAAVPVTLLPVTCMALD